MKKKQHRDKSSVYSIFNELPIKLDDKLKIVHNKLIHSFNILKIRIVLSDYIDKNTLLDKDRLKVFIEDFKTSLCKYINSHDREELEIRLNYLNKLIRNIEKHDSKISSRALIFGILKIYNLPPEYEMIMDFEVTLDYNLKAVYKTDTVEFDIIFKDDNTISFNLYKSSNQFEAVGCMLKELSGLALSNILKLIQ